MNHTSSKSPQIQKLLEKCHELLTNKESVLCLIPSHLGIQGNEMVDKQAKTWLSLEPTSFKIKGAQWLSGRVLDSRPRGRGFEPHRRHCVVVLEQDAFILA